MLEWMICAAAIAAPSPAPEPSGEAQAEFLEFLADWDATESALLDADRPVDPVGADNEAQDEAQMEKLP